MRLADQAEDVSGPERVMGREPLGEDLLHFVRQPQQDVAGAARAGRGRRLEDALQLLVVESRDHRRGQHARRHPGLAQRLDRLETPVRGGGARLHGARQGAVERRDRQEDRGEIFLRHRREQIEVAQDQARLGDDSDRLPVLPQNLENGAGELQLPFHRLVGVGVRSERDHLAAIAGAPQLLAQQAGRLRLGEDLRLEVEAGRHPEIRMGRARQ